MENTALIQTLNQIVGKRYVITDPAKSLRYRRGYRSGRGDALAVVKPGTLVQLWQVLQALHKADKIIIMQASNTGLTEGSIPAEGYDREVVVVNTLRMDKMQLINQQTQALAFPGTTLYTLESKLKKIGREPHSVIGSSCLGASVIGGINNNSGGALVQRGPAYTEMALFAKIDEKGELSLVNHLGIDLGETPEEILGNLDKQKVQDSQIIDNSKHGHDFDYKERVRQIDEETPSRYNANPTQLYEASGAAGHLAVFAVRLDTFEKDGESQMFYIGTNKPAVLEDIRRKALGEFKHLPVSGEYMHSTIFEMSEQYGRDSYIVIDKLGTDRLPGMFAMKATAERILDKTHLFKPYLPDRVLQRVGRLFPKQLPKKLYDYHEKYEHHLLLKMSGEGIAEARAYLKEYFKSADGDYFETTPEEDAAATLHRFVAAGAAIRYTEVHQKRKLSLLALDVALRRNEYDWFEELPKELDDLIELKFYYGHFLCHVLHQDYILKPGVDEHMVKEKMLELFNKRGAKYPAEHNVGHLYHAEETLVKHYKENDPTNSFNPGVGLTSKLKNWA